MHDLIASVNWLAKLRMHMHKRIIHTLIRLKRKEKQSVASFLGKSLNNYISSYVSSNMNS